MSLEQQIATLTQAVQSLESAIRSMGAVGNIGAGQTLNQAAPASAPVATAPGFGAPAPAMTAQGFGAPAPVAAPAGPSYEQVQATLAQKAQELGNPQPVVSIMLKYIPPGMKQELASVPPQNYPALLSEIATLVRAA